MKKQDRKVKTLTLSRETLVRLNSDEMTRVQGGAAAGPCTGCDSGCGIIPPTTEA